MPRKKKKSNIYFSQDTEDAIVEYIEGNMERSYCCDAEAKKVGDMNKAYTFFNIGLRADISNLYGNTYEGIHAASLGGTWQALIFGFAGVKIKKEVLWIDPRMPRTWGCLDFSLMWKGDKIDFYCGQGVKIKVNSKKKKTIPIGIFNKIHNIKPNKQYTFKRPVTKRKEEFY